MWKQGSAAVEGIWQGEERSDSDFPGRISSRVGCVCACNEEQRGE